VLILDEPSNGLDPQGIAWLREFLRHLANEGRTILVSSHLLAEMAQTVDDVVIVSNGEVQAQGPLSALTRSGASVRLRTPDVPRLVAVLGQQGLQTHPIAQDVVSVPNATPEVLGPILAANQIVLYEMVAEGSTLESTFLELTAGLGLSPDGQPAPWAQPGANFVPPPPPGAPPVGSAPPPPPGAPPPTTGPS
jgi:ABC-2 type transport system ATP-binding protein